MDERRAREERERTRVAQWRAERVTTAYRILQQRPLTVSEYADLLMWSQERRIWSDGFRATVLDGPDGPMEIRVSGR